MGVVKGLGRNKNSVLKWVFMKAFSAAAVGFALLLSGQNPGVTLPVETALSRDKVEVPVRTAGEPVDGLPLAPQLAV